MATALEAPVVARVTRRRTTVGPVACGSGVDHHWALGTGHRAAELRAVADLLGLEFVQVRM